MNLSRRVQVLSPIKNLTFHKSSKSFPFLPIGTYVYTPTYIHTNCKLNGQKQKQTEKFSFHKGSFRRWGFTGTSWSG